MITALKWIGLALLAVLAVVGIVLAGGMAAFDRRIQAEVRALLSSPPPADLPAITAEMLAGLPEPIQRHLTYAGVVGQPMVHSVRLKQTGRFRTGVDQAWMDYRAEQYYTADRPGFIWDATFAQAGIPFLKVRDRYAQGKGSILGKLGGLLTIAEAQGDDLDQGAMLRYLNEMMWFPQAYLGDNITFTPVDDGSAQVTLTDQGKSVTATLYVDAEGKMTDFVAERYFEAGDAYYPWSTPISAYGEFNGLRLPSRGKGVWKLPDGDFAYIDLFISELEYNIRAPFGAE